MSLISGRMITSLAKELGNVNGKGVGQRRGASTTKTKTKKWFGGFFFSKSRKDKVQHLIEYCLILKMTKGECIKVLSNRANIQPIITSTVWNELEKENEEFFEAYSQSLTKKDSPK
ncbi:hypothetical protein DM860_013530 [Cuscuta australis]|uniref:Uncharacterized protein n=1 Tax=Cuscuta australis TaxID=267555 RepID=A0A328EA41_9ASTE|nr:hypothetical protein DM860_013530 [Cuscuta australis]